MFTQEKKGFISQLSEILLLLLFIYPVFLHVRRIRTSVITHHVMRHSVISPLYLTHYIKKNIQAITYVMNFCLK